MSYSYYIEDGYVEQNYFQRIVDSGTITSPGVTSSNDEYYLGSNSEGSGGQVIAVATITTELTVSDERYYNEGYIAENYFAVTRQAELNAFGNASLSCELTDVSNYIDNGYVTDGYYGSIQYAQANLSMFNSVGIETIENIGDYFDNGYITDGYIIEENIVEFAADITATFTIAFDGYDFIGFTSTPNSTFSISADVEKIVEFGLGTSNQNDNDTLNSVFSINANSTRIFDLSSIVEIVSNTTQSGQRIRFGDTDIQDTFTLSNTILKIQSGTVSLTSNSSIELNYNLFVPFTTTPNSTFTTTCDANRIFELGFGANNTNSIEDASVDLHSEATVTTAIAVQREASATIESEATTTSTALRIKDFDVNIGALFTPGVTANALKNHDAILDSTADLSATISKFSGNEATLDNIINISLQADRFADYNASLSTSSSVTSSATQTHRPTISLTAQSTITCQATVANVLPPITLEVKAATVRTIVTILFRDSSLVNYQGVGNTKTIDTITTKFGSGSLKNVINSNSGALISGAVHWTGSEYVFCDFNKTYKSSDGENWQAYSSNLNSTSRVYYSNNTFTSYKFENGNNIILYSTNGTSWSSQNLNSTFNQYSSYRFDTPFYFNSKWHLPYTLTVNNWRGGFYTSSTLTTSLSNWSVNATGIATNGASFIPRGAAFTNSKARMLYEQSNSDIQIVYSDNGGTSYATNTNMPVSGNLSNTSGFNIATDGTTTGVIQNTGTNTIVYYSSNLTGSWSSKTLSNVKGEAISYANGYWFVSTSKGLYSGTSISNLTLRYQPDAYYYSIVQNTVASDGTDFTTITGDYANKVLFSSDGTTFTDTNSISGASSPAILEYSLGNNSDYNNWKTIDFWYYPTTSTFANIGGQYYYSNNQYSDINYSFVQEGSNLKFYNQTNSLQGALTINQWNHVRMVNDNGSAALFIDGTRVDTDTISLQAPNTPFVLAPYLWRNTATNYLDEFLITDDLLTSPGTTSFTVPSSAYVGDDTDIDLLLHFDGQFTDANNYNATVVPQATLSSAFTVEASLTYTATATITPPLNATLECNAGVIEQFDANLNIQSTVDADNTRLKYYQTDIDAVATVNSQAVKRTEVVATLEGVVTITPNVGRFRDLEITTESIATSLVAVAKIGDFLITTETRATVDATVTKTNGAVATLNASTTLTAANERTRDVSATLTSEFTQTSQEDYFVGFVATANATTTQVTEGNRTADFVAVISDAVSFAIEVTATRNNEILMPTTASITTDADVTRSGVATLTSTTAFQPFTTIKVDALASLNTIATTNVTGKTLRIETFEYVIPAEDREYEIVAETREATVT